jgi:hypothetical protein
VADPYRFEVFSFLLVVMVLSCLHFLPMEQDNVNNNIKTEETSGVFG